MKRGKSKPIAAVILILITAITVSCTIFGFIPYYYKNMYIAPSPTGLSVAEVKETADEVDADFYVSENGNDAFDGTKEHPFATIKRAQIELQMLDKSKMSHAVIAVFPGTYDAKKLSFNEDYCGTENCTVIYCSYGEGEVILDCTGSEGIKISKAKNMTISGFTITNAEKDGISIKKSSNVFVSYCKIKNCGRYGIDLSGTDNTVNSCTVSGSGSTGIKISGGNSKKMNTGNNTVTNCLIFTTSRSEEEAPAVKISGIGNSITHCELCNIPASAIEYSGNYNVIDYNHIHNCALKFPDQAAVTSDFSWAAYQNYIRYNCISNIGDGKSKPDGIRCCSGSIIVSNLIVNAPGTGIDLNGGRDILAKGNVIVNSSVAFRCENPDITDEELAEKAAEFKKLPIDSKEYKEFLPECASLTDDPAKANETNYIMNPANNEITDNVIMQHKGELGSISEYVKAKGSVNYNACCKLSEKKIFKDMKNGVYLLSDYSPAYAGLKYFANVPISEMGRY